MTVSGYDSLKLNLTELKNVKRREAIEAISKAREDGGELSENTEYILAREEQGHIESRISKIENKLSNATVFDVYKLTITDKVRFGMKVTVLDVDNNKEMTLTIVGEDEADMKIGKISYLSPFAKAIIGNKVGDFVIVETPNPDDERKLELLKINYPD
jgi:transcription elongation factor GreA